MNIGTDFHYDGMNLSDFGLMICSIDESADGNFSVGSVTELNTIKAPQSYVWNYLGESYSDPLEFEFTVGRIDKYGELHPIHQNEERAILKWLKQRGPYKSFYFLPSNPIDDIIHHKAKIDNVEEIKISGNTVGFSITIVTNAPFGFSKEWKYDLSANSQLTINVDSDEANYLYPRLTIKATKSGNVSLENISNGSGSSINNLSANETVIVDKNNVGVITDLGTHNVVKDFSRTWFRLEDGENICKLTGSADVSITFQEPRKVGG